MEQKQCLGCGSQFSPRTLHATRCFPCWQRFRDAVAQGSPGQPSPQPTPANPSPAWAMQGHQRSPAVAQESPAQPGSDGAAATATIGADTVFTFGKHSGRTFQDVYSNEKGYVSWAQKQDAPGQALQAFLQYVTQRSNGRRDRSRTPPRSGGKSHSDAAPASADASGDTVFTFGRYQGRTFSDVFTNEKDYVRWAQRQGQPGGSLQAFLDFASAQAGSARERPSNPPRASLGGSSHTASPAASPQQAPAETRAADASPGLADVSTVADGETVLEFGKHKGRTFKDVYTSEPDYVNWVRGLESASGRMAQFKDYINTCIVLERKGKAEERKLMQAQAEEARQAQKKLFEEEIKRMSAERREAERRQKEEEEREARDIEEQRALAQGQLQTFLECKFEEYKGGYPHLTCFEQLNTGYNPFGEIIRTHGISWMAEANHKNYKMLEEWDPRKILEWGQTYIQLYAPDAAPDAIQRQTAAIELMLRQCCLLVKPNVKRKIYWELQNKHKTFSRDIERVFGNIFTELARRSEGNVASAKPPRSFAKTSPSIFFGENFTWSWGWPVNVHVSIACKYYMWKRAEVEKHKESAEAGDRRILLIQMLLAFKEDGDLTATHNADGSDIVYRRPGGTAAILVEAPDEGALHVFQRPKGVSDREHEERIFALFRPFNSLVTRMITRNDNTRAFAKFGEVEELPEDFVVEALPKRRDTAKVHKHHALLEAHPEMKAALSVKPDSARPSLQEFLGWDRIITHRKQELMKEAFEEALGLSAKRAKAIEAKAIKAIKAARRDAGEAHVEFAGGSWH